MDAVAAGAVEDVADTGIEDAPAVADPDEDHLARYGQHEGGTLGELTYMRTHWEPVVHDSRPADVEGPDSSFDDEDYCVKMDGSQAVVVECADDGGRVRHFALVEKQKQHVACAGTQPDPEDVEEDRALGASVPPVAVFPYHHRHHHPFLPCH